jgi:hypothetical protein
MRGKWSLEGKIPRKGYVIIVYPDLPGLKKKTPASGVLVLIENFYHKTAFINHKRREERS